MKIESPKSKRLKEILKYSDLKSLRLEVEDIKVNWYNDFKRIFYHEIGHGIVISYFGNRVNSIKVKPFHNYGEIRYNLFSTPKYSVYSDIISLGGIFSYYLNENIHKFGINDDIKSIIDNYNVNSIYDLKFKLIRKVINDSRVDKILEIILDESLDYIIKSLNDYHNVEDFIYYLKLIISYLLNVFDNNLELIKENFVNEEYFSKIKMKLDFNYIYELSNYNGNEFIESINKCSFNKKEINYEF